MNERDLIGKRGEDVFAYLIGKRCDGRFWFVANFVDGKTETKDFNVSLINSNGGEVTLYVQVKATLQGYRGKGARRKLKVNVSKADVAKLKKVAGPVYIAGIDVVGDVGFLLAITRSTPDKAISGLSCKNRIDCKLIPELWKEVQNYWNAREMQAASSLFS